VQETMISANLLRLLENIVDISSETVSDGALRQPWARVSGVTISG